VNISIRFELTIGRQISPTRSAYFIHGSKHSNNFRGADAEALIVNLFCAFRLAYFDSIFSFSTEVLTEFLTLLLLTIPGGKA
jgi:hypothetical protein